MNHLDALTKLLAEENLQIVVDQSASTASFNTHTRLLTLPVIIGCPEDFKMRLRAHEVGHAKYTPRTLSDTFAARVRQIRYGVSERIKHSLINICEDVRIDRLMLEQYPGLIKEYLSSQIYMADSDFFSLAGRDPNAMSFPDRINLNSKLGMRAGIRFAPDEREVLSEVESANTPEEIIEAALKVFELMEKQKEEQKLESQPKEQPSPKASPKKEESQDEEESEPEAKIESSVDESADHGDAEESDESDYQPQEQPKVQAENPMEISTSSAEESNLRRMVVATSKNRPIVFGDVSLRYKTHIVDLTHSAKSIPTSGEVPWEAIDNLRDEMLAASKSDVDYLVSIFNQRKAAKDAVLKGKYRSGRIDFNRISRHNYSESFFRQYNISPECKNHGVFILLDMSGSMFPNWKDTLQQLMVVVEFCVKTNIPYEVLGFTADRNVGTVLTSSDIQVDASLPLKLIKIAKTGTQLGDRKECYSALLITAPSPTLNRRRWGNKFLVMESTPFMPAMIELRSYLRKFISQHRTAKNTLIVISDGAGDGYRGPSASSSHVYVSPLSGEEMKICGASGMSQIGRVLRDEEAKFLEILKKDFAKFDLTIINFFFAEKTHPSMSSAERATFRRYGMMDVGASDGFDKMIFMKSTPEEQDLEITGKENAAALAKKMIGQVDNQGKALSRSIMQILA